MRQQQQQRQCKKKKNRNRAASQPSSLPFPSPSLHLIRQPLLNWQNNVFLHSIHCRRLCPPARSPASPPACRLIYNQHRTLLHHHRFVCNIAVRAYKTMYQLSQQQQKQQSVEKVFLIFFYSSRLVACTVVLFHFSVFFSPSPSSPALLAEQRRRHSSSSAVVGVLPHLESVTHTAATTTPITIGPSPTVRRLPIAMLWGGVTPGNTLNLCTGAQDQVKQHECVSAATAVVQHT